jgi:hypothetical protein
MIIAATNSVFTSHALINVELQVETELTKLVVRKWLDKIVHSDISILSPVREV